MPTFTNEPPHGQGRSGLRLIRTPAARPLLAIVTTEELIGCPTHFAGNRTVPCEQPDCPLCDQGYPWRWHAYVACQLTDTHQHVIFECTAQASDAFKQHFNTCGSLRGCHFKAWRANQKTNGRVIILTKPADLAGVNLPPAPDLPKLLCHIWNVPDKLATTVAGRPDCKRLITEPGGNTRGTPSPRNPVQNP